METIAFIRWNWSELQKDYWRLCTIQYAWLLDLRLRNQKRKHSKTNIWHAAYLATNELYGQLESRNFHAKKFRQQLESTSFVPNRALDKCKKWCYIKVYFDLRFALATYTRLGQYIPVFKWILS